METERICPSCRRPLAPDSPQGLCPECLIQAGFGTGVAPEPGEPTSRSAFTPPPLAEMAKLFPQLEIVELLGRGGMGAVYKARQPALDRWVALKILPPQSTSRPGFTERFNREARALARLSHANIVAMYEFGQVGGMPYFAMEYVEGVTLRRLVQERRLEPREALRIVPQICEALQFAHNEGVVHRDIKPENILLDKKGRVKIADFGIAKIVTGDQPQQTITEDQVIGTPHYMAPEQVEKPQTVDHRADIYSLGVVFYEMLTGELPLGKFQPPSKKVHMDVRLDEVVLHALEKEPDRRYQHASEVKTAVETIAATPPGSSRHEEAHSESGSASQSAAMQEAQSRVKAPAIGLLVAGIIDLAAVLFLLVEFVAVLLSYQTLSAGAATHPPGVSSRLLFFLPLCAALLASGVVILFGAFKMQRLKSYDLSVAASILAMITPPGLLVGLPFGIWALIVLNRREIKAAFEAASRKPTRESAAAAPRFSRTAIWGACCLVPTVLSGAGALLAASQSIALALQTPNLPRPLPQQFLDQGRAIFLVAILSQVFGAICALAGTTLGWIAVAQIRRSAGKLYGLGLAVFDGLLFPLLALDGLVYLFWRLVGTAAGQVLVRELDLREPSLTPSVVPSLVLLLASVTCVVVDLVIIRKVWRAVNRPLANGQAAPTPGSAVGAAASRLGVNWKVAVVILAAIMVVISIPVSMFLMRSAGLQRPRLATSLFGREVELSLDSLGSDSGDRFLDLDEAKIAQPPREYSGWSRERKREWLRENGIDLMTLGNGLQPWNLLTPVDNETKLSKVPAHSWERGLAPTLDEAPPEQPETVQLADQGVELLQLRLEGRPTHPDEIFAFQTANGARGLLQISGLKFGAGDEPIGLKLRFKKFQFSPATARVDAIAVGPVKDVFAMAAREGDIGVYLNSVGTVESSNSVTFAIPDSFCQDVIRRFNARQALTVEAYNPQREKFGHGFLAWVADRIDRDTAMLKCRASLMPEGKNLMVPGLSLKLRLLLEVKHGVTLVSAEAIFHDAQGAFVWAIEADQTVSQRQVQVGTQDGANVEIQSGLSPAELVVVGPAKNDLHEGRKIRYELVTTEAGTQSPAQAGRNSAMFHFATNGATVYRTAPITRGDVAQVVNASGTLDPLLRDAAAWRVSAPVHEADIADVAIGQRVRFTVEAFPGRVFSGNVIQISNAPVRVQNVVAYDTLVEVADADPKFRPGMTANLSIIIAQRENVLRIPNAALHFSPPEVATATPAAPKPGATGASGSERTVYVVTAGGSGKPVAVRIRSGITDGVVTEVTEGLKEGDRVVVAMISRPDR